MSRELTTLWRRFPLRTGQVWLDLLLPAVPLALVLAWLHINPLAVFIFSALGLVPLAGVLGVSTEAMAAWTNPSVGGLLNATMGNATELIVGLVALQSGHTEVVKASLSGSIIGNLLLVLGLSLLAGGIGREKQEFSRTVASTNCTMLFIASVGLIMPAVFDLAVFGHLGEERPILEHLSLWTAAILMLTYLVGLLFTLKTHRVLFSRARAAGEEPEISRNQALVRLALATILIAILSELLMRELHVAQQAFGFTDFFMGVIVVALVGNAAEHTTAITAARHDQVELAMTIGVGSSTQIALFVAPVLVFTSVAMRRPMSLVFNAFEIAAIVLSVVAVQMISQDGESNWLEGAQLLAIYLLLAVAFYFVPA